MDPEAKVGPQLEKLWVEPVHPGDDVIDHDIVLYWTGDTKRVITGGDILGRLLHGIAQPLQEIGGQPA